MSCSCELLPASFNPTICQDLCGLDETLPSLHCTLGYGVGELPIWALSIWIPIPVEVWLPSIFRYDTPNVLTPEALPGSSNVLPAAERSNVAPDSKVYVLLPPKVKSVSSSCELPLILINLAAISVSLELISPCNSLMAPTRSPEEVPSV